MAVIQIEQKEVDENNVKTLRLRKLEYKRDLTLMLEKMGYLFIILLYLKNISFVRFIIRMALQCIVANPFPANLPNTFTKEVRQSLTKSFLMSLITINSVFFFLDILIGVPHTENVSGLFHGSLTLQIIGEEPPYSRWSYVYYNTAIASIQFIVLYLSCLLNTDEDFKEHSNVLPGSTYSLNQVEGDGFTGQSMVCCIHPYDIYQMIMGFTTTSQSHDSATSYNDYMGDRLDITRML